MNARSADEGMSCSANAESWQPRIDGDPHATLPPTAEAAINEIAEILRSAWADGKRPDIDGMIPEGFRHRDALLRRLVTVEWELRLKADEQVSVDEYRARFSKLASDTVFWASLLYLQEKFAAGQLGNPAKRKIEVPVRLGEYEVLHEIARGGMGVVYKARHVRLKKIVALKVLPADRVIDKETVDRFHREMEAVGQLRDVHVIEAYDAGESNGTHYLAVEFVDGMDLMRLVEHLRIRTSSRPPSKCHTEWTGLAEIETETLRGSLPLLAGIKPLPVESPLQVADACELIRQAALGLHHAHERGLVHRDIKPSNLLLSVDGIVKVLDLGLARLHSEQPLNTLTGAGQMMGTVDYMAPEQITNSHQVDRRADLYSLGCTLYHLLAGHPPFAGPNYSSGYLKLKAHENDSPPSILRSDLPQGVTLILRKLLSKSPADRYGSAAEVVAALEPFTRGCDPLRLIKVAKGEATSVHVPAESTNYLDVSNSDDTRKTGSELVTSRRFDSSVIYGAICAAVAGVVVLAAIVVSLTPKQVGNPAKDVGVAARERPGDIPLLEPGAVKDDSPDRRAVEFVLSFPGANCTVFVDNVLIEALQSGAKLPPTGNVVLTNIERVGTGTPFAELIDRLNGTRIQALNFWNTPVKDGDLTRIAGLKFLDILTLDNTEVTDACLVHVAQIPNLSALSLRNTFRGPLITDAGMPQLAGMTLLRRLYLQDTAVGNAGLLHLRTCVNLTHLFLGETEVTDDGLSALVELQLLESLSLSGTNVTDAGIATLERLPKLKSLDLSKTPVSEKCLKRLLEKLPAIDQLSINGTNIGDDVIPVLLDRKELRNLDINCTRISSKGYAKLKSTFPNADQISWSDVEQTVAVAVLSAGGSITIRTVGKNDEEVVKEISAIPQAPFHVTRIHFHSREPNSTDLAAAYESMSGLFRCFPTEGLRFENLVALELTGPFFRDSSLTNLRIEGYPLHERHWARTTNLEKPASRLRELSLADTQITDEGMAEIQQFTQLRKLVLDRTPIRGSGLKHLKAFPELVELQLACPMLTDDFLASLGQLNKLEKLSLQNSAITDDSIDALCHLESLKELNVTGTRLSSIGIKSLSERLSRCRVISTLAGEP